MGLGFRGSGLLGLGFRVQGQRAFRDLKALSFRRVAFALSRRDPLTEPVKDPLKRPLKEPSKGVLEKGARRDLKGRSENVEDAVSVAIPSTMVV